MRITIIGAGFSGVALASALQRTAPAGTTVCLVGVEESFGRGVAYGAARPEHLLNTRARDLGLDPQAPQDFADWFSLGERGRAGFLPRQVYGEYLHERVQALTAGNPGVGVHALRREAVAIDRGERALHVHLDDGAMLVSDRVVLAIGALPPPPLAGVGPRLALHPRYLGSPWQEDAIERIDRDARVLVVGTGLTMVDVVATLRQRGHAGRIDALSRHGLLPLRHDALPPPALALPPNVLQALAGHDRGGLLRALRALSSVADVRALVDALRPYLQAFWRGLPDRQRSRFLRHVRAYWEVARHRLAPQAGEQLDGMLASGQLRVRAGRLVRASRGEDAVEALIRERGSRHVQRERYDVLIRATGLNTDVARTTHPLLSQLRESGLVSADRHALGLAVNDRFEVLDARGHAMRGLYCLGPLLRGKLWEITAIPELRAAAQQLAARLATPNAIRDETAAGRRQRHGSAGT